MSRLSKGQFNRAIEGAGVGEDKGSGVGEDKGSGAGEGKNVPPVPRNQPNRTSKVLVTSLVVLLGIGAGWLGGKALNGRNSRSTEAAPPGDNSNGNNSSNMSEAQPESRPARRAATSDKSVKESDPVPEAEQSLVPSESRAKEGELKEVPPKVPRVEKDEADNPAVEDPSKEIGREALKKMSKDMKKRALGNKNENEDNQ